MMKKVPKRRFKGFLNAGDWEQRKLEGLCDLFTDGDWIESKDQCGSGVRLIQTGNIGITEYLDKPDNKKWISDETFNQLHCKEVFPGDILISRLPEPAGRACIIPHLGTKMITAVDCTIVRTSTNTTASFLVQYLSSQPYFNEVNKCLAGGTRQRISRSALAEFKVLVPSEKAEQDIIGKVFDKFDILITLHQRKLEKLQATKKALLYELFPIENSRRPKRRFKGFTGDWEQRKLGELVTVFSGRDYKHLSEGDIPVYGTGGYMLSVNEALSNDQDAIGIGRKGTIDKPYILKAPFWTVDTLFYAIPKEKMDLNFIFCIFKNVDWRKLDESTGVPSLSKSTITNVDVYCPFFEEQLLIGRFFSWIDSSITLHQRKLEKLKNLKAAYLNEMFV